MAARFMNVQKHSQEASASHGAHHSFGAADLRAQHGGEGGDAGTARKTSTLDHGGHALKGKDQFWSEIRDGPSDKNAGRARHDPNSGARKRPQAIVVDDSSFVPPAASSNTKNLMLSAQNSPLDSPLDPTALRKKGEQSRRHSMAAGWGATPQTLASPTGAFRADGRELSPRSEASGSEVVGRSVSKRGTIDRAAVDGSTSQLSAALEADEAEADATKTKRCMCLVDPRNMWKLRWDLVIAIFIIFSVILVPLRLSFGVETEGAWLVIDIIIDVCFGLDIFITFNTAYYLDGVLVTNRRKIANAYFMGMFWIDFVSTVPFHHIAWIVETVMSTSSTAGGYLQGMKLLKALRLVRLLRLGRLLKLRRIANVLEEQLGVNTAVLTFGAVVFTVLFSIHILACFWYYVGPGLGPTLDMLYGADPITNTSVVRSNWLTVYIASKFPDSPNEFDSIERQYVASVYWAAATAMSVGYGDIFATTDLERMYSIIALLVGAGLFGYIISSVSTMITTAAPRQAEMQRQLQEVVEYTREQGLPRKLRRDIVEHFEHFLSWKSVYDETGILSNMSDPLAELVVRNRYREVIMRIDMLNNGLDDVIPRSLQGETHSASRRGGAAVAAALAAAEEGMRRRRTDMVRAHFGKGPNAIKSDRRSLRLARRVTERIFACAKQSQQSPLDHIAPSALPGGFMCALLPLMRPFRISSGSIVFGPNDSPGEMYFILDGVVEIALGNAGHIGDLRLTQLDEFGFRMDVPRDNEMEADDLGSPKKASRMRMLAKRCSCKKEPVSSMQQSGEDSVSSFEFPFLTNTGIVGGTVIRTRAIWEGTSDRGAVGFYAGDRCIFQFFIKLGALCQWYVRHESGKESGGSGFEESGPYAKEQLQEWLASDVLPPTVLVARATADRSVESAWVPLGEAPLPLFACREADRDETWGSSMLGTGGKISKGAELELEILVNQGDFSVKLNGRRVAEFRCSDTVNLSDVTEISWDFDFGPLSATIHIPSVVVGILTHGQHFGEEHVLWVDDAVDAEQNASGGDGVNEQRWDPWASALPGSFTYSAAVNCSVLSITASELQQAALVEFPEINQLMLNHARRRWWLLERTSRKVVARTNHVASKKKKEASVETPSSEAEKSTPKKKLSRGESKFGLGSLAPKPAPAPAPIQSEAFVAAAGAIPIMHNATIVTRAALRTARLWPQPRSEHTHKSKLLCVVKRPKMKIGEEEEKNEIAAGIEMKVQKRRAEQKSKAAEVALSPSEQIEMEFTVSDDEFFENTKDTTLLTIPKFAGDVVLVEMTAWEVLRKKWMCHPRLPLKIIWDLFVGALIVYSVVVVPWRISFNVPSVNFSPNFWVDFVIDVCFFLDIITSFRTPYLDNETGGFVLLQCYVALNYLKLWFWIDLVSTIPVDTIFVIFDVGGQEVMRSLRLIRVLRLARLLKLVRLLKLSKLAPSLSEITYELPAGFGKLTRLVLEAGLVAHLLACFFFLSSYVFDKDKPSYDDSWWGAMGTQIEDGDYWRQYLASLCVVAISMSTKKDPPFNITSPHLLPSLHTHTHRHPQVLGIHNGDDGRVRRHCAAQHV